MYNLSIIIPVYNEINYLRLFTERLEKSFENENVEYIYVNDGSTDGSSEWIEKYISSKNNYQFKFINIKKNQGKGKAIQEGLKISEGDYILFQDSDLELNPQDSFEIYEIAKKDDQINCIFGSRFISGKLKSNKNYLNEFVAKLNSTIFNILFMQSINDLHCGTKLISKEIKKKLNLTINDFGFEIDIATQIAKMDYEIFEVGVSYISRTSNEGKKITWIDGLKSYYYFFKTRFIQNSFSTKVSIIFSLTYMIYIGANFENEISKNLFIILFSISGLFLGLHRKIINSFIVFLFTILGGILIQGENKIYSVLIFFVIGIFISKKISIFIKLKFKNVLINHLF